MNVSVKRYVNSYNALNTMHKQSSEMLIEIFHTNVAKARIAIDSTGIVLEMKLKFPLYSSVPHNCDHRITDVTKQVSVHDIPATQDYPRRIECV